MSWSSKQIRGLEGAKDRWRSILPAFGISDGFLTGKQCPCPMCEGRDRFVFDNRDGDGTWFCTHCGAGDAVRLVMLKQGLEFKMAVTEIAKRINGSAPPDPSQRPKERTPLQKREMLRRTWAESQCIGLTSPAGKYLYRRCELTSFPPSLRFAPKLLYRDETQSSFFPALLAQVADAEGEAVNIHRTYLDDAGFKAPVGDPRRMMEGPLPPGCAIRLAPPSRDLGLAEGIETALSCRKLFGIGTWASISAVGMTKWVPPAGCENVTIFGDNDENFVGQQAAMTLAMRLHREGYDVEVRIPDQPGTDWNDVHQGVM